MASKLRILVTGLIAQQGIEEINRRYSFHCQAAREVAREYFDSRKVLSRLIDEAFHFAASQIA